MTRTERLWRGALKPRMRGPCRVRSNANGVFSLRLCLDHVGDLFSRFKLFLEPHALRDSSNVDPRLPSLPVSSTFSGSFPMLILSDRAASVLSISSSTSCHVFGTTLSSRSPAKSVQSLTSVCAVCSQRSSASSMCLMLCDYYQIPRTYGSLYLLLGMPPGAR